MPCEIIKVALKPVNFFDKNPALDVPPSTQAVNQSVLVTAQNGTNGHATATASGATTHESARASPPAAGRAWSAAASPVSRCPVQGRVPQGGRRAPAGRRRPREDHRWAR